MRKSALTLFRHLPARLRRLLVHLATPSFTVGVVAILRRNDGRLALVEQRHSPGWALPGGLLGRGEPAVDGLVREIVEEIGIVLDPAAMPLPYAAVSAGSRRVDVVYFVDAAADAVMRIKDDVEVTGVGWFALDDMPPITEPTVEILRAVRLL